MQMQIKSKCQMQTLCYLSGLGWPKAFYLHFTFTFTSVIYLSWPFYKLRLAKNYFWKKNPFALSFVNVFHLLSPLTRLTMAKNTVFTLLCYWPRHLICFLLWLGLEWPKILQTLCLRLNHFTLWKLNADHLSSSLF